MSLLIETSLRFSRGRLLGPEDDVEMDLPLWIACVFSEAGAGRICGCVDCGIRNAGKMRDRLAVKSWWGWQD